MQTANTSWASPKNGTLSPFDGPQWPHLASRSIYTSVAVLMGVVVISASLLNGLVIAVSVRFKKLRSPLNYILVNLAMADLLVTFFGSTISFVNNAVGFFMFGKTVCQLEGFMVSLTGKVDHYNTRGWVGGWVGYWYYHLCIGCGGKLRLRKEGQFVKLQLGHRHERQWSTVVRVPD